MTQQKPRKPDSQQPQTPGGRPCRFSLTASEGIGPANPLISDFGLQNYLSAVEATQLVVPGYSSSRKRMQENSSD